MDIKVSDYHKLDTSTQVFFYEQDFYVLSNFSSFEIEWSGFTFKTAEHLYHWLKFILSDDPDSADIAHEIRNARSAHDAFKIAQNYRDKQADIWDEVKLKFMKKILRAKADQHEYVRRKLMLTSDRELVEDSWRDNYWGWGPNKDGQNWLGKIWMEVREDLRNNK